MKSLLIRAEDKNIWERRSPIVPTDLKQLLSEHSITAYIQKSEKRFFKETEYSTAGAQICDDMSPGDVILGIKEIPEHKILDNKVYLFFSHTIKGQAYNMSMLQRIMDSGSTLIDYEKITDEKNRRLIFFGNFAGDVGAIDILWLMGEYWKHHGIQTPFSQYKQAINYQSIKEAQDHLRDIGKKIHSQGLPEQISPLVIGILGYGNVSKGAQAILDCLPVQRIEPEQLKSFSENKKGNSKTIYVSIFKEQHLVRNKQEQPFDLQDYYQHPENYTSQFDPYLNYITILVNAIYWESRYPRFVTWDTLQNLHAAGKKPKLCGISDITCDVNGSIECNLKTTDSGMPAYLCHPLTRTITDGHHGDGIVLLAIDNLPAEVPNDASVFFSNQLKRFVPNLVAANYHSPLADSGLLPELQKAVIVYNGKLTPSYEYLKKYLNL